jgi:CheY-like chemotaxis protein/HPt (histidine-containing phosphotransfer) domain-containing protein
MQVVGAMDHLRALEALASPTDSADVVLIDLQLPDLDGYSLAAKIRSSQHLCQIPIVLLSSQRVRSDDPRLGELGITGIIYKPIRPAQLLERLCEALSVPVHALEKKAPRAPALDANLAKRLPLRLLLADDNPINQKVGLSVLRKLGYRADIANNGVEVLKALEQCRYDIIFLDVQMPEMDGLEAAQQICSRYSASNRPRIVAMTGNALLGDREICLNAGMDDYISKPVQIRDIQAALEKWGSPSNTITINPKSADEAPASVDEFLDFSVIEVLRDIPGSEGITTLQEIVDLFLESAPARIDQIRASIHDPDGLNKHAHALRSMSLQVGAKRVTRIAASLEEMGRTRQLQTAPGLCLELTAAFADTKPHLLGLRSS